MSLQEIQDRIRIIELYAKDRQFADFVRQHQAWVPLLFFLSFCSEINTWAEQLGYDGGEKGKWVWDTEVWQDCNEKRLWLLVWGDGPCVETDLSLLSSQQPGAELIQQGWNYYETQTFPGLPTVWQRVSVQWRSFMPDKPQLNCGHLFSIKCN